MTELQHRKILKTFSNIIKLFHCSCSSRADCKIMRLFFLSACVPSRIIRSRYFFTLDVLRRMSCYFCIVTVKRGCYDRHRALHFADSQGEKTMWEMGSFSLRLPFSPPCQTSTPRRHQIPLTLILLSMDAENSLLPACSFQASRPD